MIIVYLVFIFLFFSLFIAVLGIIHPKLVIIWYFKGKNRLYYAHSAIIIVMLFFVLSLFADAIDPNIDIKNLNSNNAILNSKNNHLINANIFESRYKKFYKIEDILFLNSKINNNSNELLSLNLNENFAVNFKFDDRDNIISVDALAKLTNEHKNIKKYVSTFKALIYSTDLSLTKENALMIYSQLDKGSLLSKDSKIKLNNFTNNNIEYKWINIPNESVHMSISKTTQTQL